MASMKSTQFIFAIKFHLLLVLSYVPQLLTDLAPASHLHSAAFASLLQQSSFFSYKIQSMPTSADLSGDSHICLQRSPSTTGLLILHSLMNYRMVFQFSIDLITTSSISKAVLKYGVYKTYTVLNIYYVVVILPIIYIMSLLTSGKKADLFLTHYSSLRSLHNTPILRKIRL